ncbi:MAG: hypothetical protein IPN96_04405 [Anaerolineales bacterium]|nr:hypothetical protein [Anaerolineales bacterium]
MSALNADSRIGCVVGFTSTCRFSSCSTAIAIGWFFGLMSGAILHGFVARMEVCWRLRFGMVLSISSQLLRRARTGRRDHKLLRFVMVWAVALIFIYKPANLSAQEKQVIK